MPSTLSLQINGQKQSFAASTVAELVQQMDLKTDRVAVELNGEIVSRPRWTDTPVAEGDRLEIVHFVGGGSHEETTHPGGIA